MHEAICSTCGAINQAGTEICWRCLASVRGAAALAADAQRNGFATTAARSEA